MARVSCPLGDKRVLLPIQKNGGGARAALHGRGWVKGGLVTRGRLATCCGLLARLWVRRQEETVVLLYRTRNACCPHAPKRKHHPTLWRRRVFLLERKHQDLVSWFWGFVRLDRTRFRSVFFRNCWFLFSLSGDPASSARRRHRYRPGHRPHRCCLSPLL